jgi:hypothetical protein
MIDDSELEKAIRIHLLQFLISLASLTRRYRQGNLYWLNIRHWLIESCRTKLQVRVLLANLGVRIFIRCFVFSFLCLSPFVHAANTIAISAVGDIMLGTDYPYNRLPKDDGDEWFDAAKPWIKSAHVRFGNFEGTFFDGDAQPDGKPDGVNHFSFRTPTRLVSLLQDAGFNVMSLANNHVRDFGLAGFKSTKQTLSQAGIQYSSKSGEVARFKVEQTSIALIAADFYRGGPEPNTWAVVLKRFWERIAETLSPLLIKLLTLVPILS